MKKIFFPGVLLALLFIFSCSKDEFTEEDAVQAQKDLITHQDSIQQVRDSLEKVGGILQFSVSVVPVDGGTGFVSGTSKSADAAEMLSGATVSVSQHGQLLTATTDESGIAVFTDLRVGQLNVSVRANGYTSGNFVAFVDVTSTFDQETIYENETAAGSKTTWSYKGVLRQAAIMVPVFNLDEGTSTIKGVLTFEEDLTNDEPEYAEGVNVIATLDVQDADFKSKYFGSLEICPSCECAAAVTQFAYNELTASGITDADGVYSLEIPSAADGMPIILQVDDFETDQTLLVDQVYCNDVLGAQTLRATFGSDIVASTIDYNGKPAYVQFSAPTGNAQQQPVEKASASAIIGESGIAAIIITDQGDGYTQPPVLEIEGDGVGATAVAYISEGKVTSVEITNAGKGYSTAKVNILEHGADYGALAAADDVISYGITDYENIVSGSGYQSTPDVQIISSSGAGATAKAIMSGYVTKVTVTNQGEGYVCPPNVIFERGAGNLPTLLSGSGDSIIMTEFNPIYSIELSQAYIDANPFTEVPEVVITRSSNGGGATAIVDLESAGGIDEIVLANAGAGYIELPSVRILGGGGTAAVAQAIWDDKGVGSIAVEILEDGYGYTSTPTVEISLPPAGGTPPVIEEVVRSFKIKSITLTNPGEGYDIKYDEADADNYAQEPTVEINGVAIANDGDVTVRPNMKLEEIILGNGGSDYDVAPAITIAPACGYGSGATATTEILYNVKDIIPVNEGSGYIDVNDIVVTVVTPPEGCEAQASCDPVLGAGVLEQVVIEPGDEGAAYVAQPNVYLIHTNGTNDTVYVAMLSSTVSGGAITAIDNGGVSGLKTVGGYHYDIVIRTFEEAAVFGTEAYAQSGKLSFVEIIAPGAGYTVAPEVKFRRVKPATPGTPINYGDASTYDIIEDGAFIPAEATAVLADGRVVEINITNPGTGYYYAPIVEIEVLVGLQVATATLDVSPDGYVNGIIGGSLVGGKGYEEAPTVTIRAAVPGMGSGATATAIVEAGVVKGIVMTNHGSGYLGKNTPTDAVECSLLAPDASGSGVTNNAKFDVYAGKSYIKDIYLGTGSRDIDCN